MTDNNILNQPLRIMSDIVTLNYNRAKLFSLRMPLEGQ